MSQDRFVVDFVTKNESEDEWKMVLVEEGDWGGELSEHLHRIQNRLYECIDAALDGQLAEQFPNSKGKKVVIQIDCYDAPRKPIEDFFLEFSNAVMKLPDYANSLAENSFVQSIDFQINFDSTSQGILH